MKCHIAILFNICTNYVRICLLAITLILLQQTLVNQIINTLEYINAIKFIVLNLSKVHIINNDLQYITLIRTKRILRFYKIIKVNLIKISNNVNIFIQLNQIIGTCETLLNQVLLEEPSDNNAFLMAKMIQQLHRLLPYQSGHLIYIAIIYFIQ